jgi:1,4-alpha-glucan branching enzyme
MRKNSPKQKTKKIQFSFKAGPAKKVSLVGEFNNWDPDADPMQRDGNGTWTKAKMLSAYWNNTTGLSWRKRLSCFCIDRSS